MVLMDASSLVESYGLIVKKVLSSYPHESSLSRQAEEFERQLICDDAAHHYLLLDVGWQQGKRFASIIFHLDIKDGIVWVQQDNTDWQLVKRLILEGIPLKDMVLAFHSPSMRQYIDELS
ncbi:MAG: XisI protein [Deinococcales bacterium]